jgi:PAS domain S-box-containing protein
LQGRKVKVQLSIPDEEGLLILNSTFTPFFNQKGEVDMFMISSLNITEEEMAKRALKESEEKYRHIFYSNPMPLLICDIQNGNFLDVNDAAVAQYGYSREEFLGMQLSDVRPVEDKESFRQIIRSLQDHSMLYKGEATHQKKNGSLMRVEVASYGIKYEGKQVALVLSNDITDRKKSEEALRYNERRFRSLIENGNEIIGLHDANGTVIYVSPSITQILGYGPTDAIGLSAFESISPGDVPMLKRKLAALLGKPGATETAQWQHKHADGSWRWMEGVATNLLHDPAVNAIVHNFRDVTAQKETEKKILLEKELSESIINSLPGIFYLYNKEGKFIRWNRNFEKISGYSAEEISHMHPLDFFADAEKPLLAGSIERVFRTGNADVEAHFFTKDGKRLDYYFNGWACEFENETCLIGMGIDITERKMAQEAIRDSEEKRRLIMNAALDAIICMDTKGMITFWNPQAEKIFGWKEEEVKGRLLAAIIIPNAFRYMHAKGLENYLLTREGHTVNRLLEMRAIDREGKEFPIELTILPIQQGGEEFFCSFIRDITVRKRSEDAIRISNERYHVVTKATNDSIWDWDLLTNEVVRDGKRLETLYGHEGWDPTEVDIKWNAHAHPEDWARVTARRNAIFADPLQNYWEDEYRFLRKDGEYGYVFDRGYVIRDEEGKAMRMIGASQDITERKKQEEALKHKNSELKRLSTYLQGVREAERKYIAREVHDELGQLASALKIDIDWLNIRLPGMEDNARKRIDHANKTIQILINSIRKIASSLRPSVLDDFGLNAALKWHCTEFQNLNGVPCTFDAGFDDSDLPMYVKTEFFRMAQESLTNVMRHANASQVAVSTSEDANNLYLLVTDNGAGFDTNQHKNTLGLIGLRERAVSLNGRLTIESKPGKGTRISAIIPKQR